MLPVKYHFVIDSSAAQFNEYLKLIEEGRAYSVFTNGDLSWCLQTYCILSRQGKLQVSCSNNFVDNAINIIHSDYLLRIKGDPTKFIVCIKADYPSRKWAQFHVVQNKNEVSANASFMPHWIQPNLIGRDPSRNGVYRVAYVGEQFKGNLAGTSEAWKTLLQPYGIEFSLLQSGSWHDLSNVDVLIGIRSFNSNEYNNKPPTKLFNAWLAQIPFVGGYDSAFRQVGIPGKEYLIAKTPQQALEAILLLKENKELYENLIRNGICKGRIYNEETICLEWIDLLTGPVSERYKKWLLRPVFERFRFLVLLKVGLAHHYTKQVLKKVFKIRRHINYVPKYFS